MDEKTPRGTPTSENLKLTASAVPLVAPSRSRPTGFHLPLWRQEPVTDYDAAMLRWRLECPVRRVRRYQGLGTDALATKAGLEPCTVRRVERGQPEVQAITLGLIADALGVALGDLHRARESWRLRKPDPEDWAWETEGEPT